MPNAVSKVIGMPFHNYTTLTSPIGGKGLICACPIGGKAIVCVFWEFPLYLSMLRNLEVL